MSELNEPNEVNKNKNSEKVGGQASNPMRKFDPLKALNDFLGVKDPEPERDEDNAGAGRSGKGEPVGKGSVGAQGSEAAKGAAVGATEGAQNKAGKDQGAPFKTLIVGICDLEKDFRSEFRNVFEDKENFTGIKIETYQINGLNPLLSFLTEKQPDILIFGPSWDKQSISGFYQKNPTMRGKFTVLWASNSVRSDDESKDLIKSRQVDHFIKLPVLVADLVDTVRAVIAVAAKNKAAVRIVHTPRTDRDANIVMIFAAKGGVGKTIISSNLAVYLAARKFRTLLIDLDLQFGDAGLVLDLKPENTISDLCESEELMSTLESDSGILKFITKHKSGLHVLHAPLSPEFADLINAQQVRRIVEKVRSEYDFIVFDTPAMFNEVILSGLEMSDQVYLIANLDLPCVKNTKLAFDTLDLLGIQAKKIEVVVNKFDNIGIDIREVESVLARKITMTLPNDSNVLLAVNRGEPVIGVYPKSAFTKGFLPFAQNVEKVSGKRPGQPSQQGERVQSAVAPRLVAATNSNGENKTAPMDSKGPAGVPTPKDGRPIDRDSAAGVDRIDKPSRQNVPEGQANVNQQTQRPGQAAGMKTSFA